MTCNIQRLKSLPTVIALGLCSITGGCGSPPSVVPMLNMVERVLEDEANRIREFDRARDIQFLAQARQSLAAGYRQDLIEAETLSAAWVQDATTVYVAAREALMQQEFDLTRQRQTRINNLRAAAEAQSRAASILQQQDRLLQQTVGLDLWRLDPNPKEASTWD